MSAGLVMVFAHDPVAELNGAAGAILVEPELAERLVDECRAERIDASTINDSLRFVAGSPANLAARAALQRAREALPARKRRAPAERGA
jgi:hypothetical protein